MDRVSGDREEEEREVVSRNTGRSVTPWKPPREEDPVVAGTPVRHRGMRSAVVVARFPSAGLQSNHKLAVEECIGAAVVVGSKGLRSMVVDLVAVLVAGTVGRSEEGRQAMQCRGEVGALVCADGGRCSIYRTC